MLTCVEFRMKRDQNALDGFYLRWPILTAKKNALLKQMKAIDIRQTTWVLTDSAKKHELEDKEALKKKCYEISNEITMIEAEAPIRKMNLGLMPIPKEPSPELKLRLTVFMLDMGKELLMKGMAK